MRSVGLALLSLLGCMAGCSGGGGTGGVSTTPTAQTYTIGGTVSGLASGASLELYNGSDPFTLHSNGPFTFAQAVASGGAYDVWVYGEPTSPVQFCTVSNGTGTASSNVTNVQVVCSTPSTEVLYDFGPAPDGLTPSPAGPLVFDKAGNLYGVTTYGGTGGQSTPGGVDGEGTVFKLTPGNSQWTMTVLYTFCQTSGCPDGAQPGAGLTWDAAGNLYGTTDIGGAFGGGTVFELSPNGSGGWTETVLHSFGNGTDGSGAADGISGLVFDRSGNLYGTTGDGGAGGICEGLGCGTAFELSPGPGGTWTESVIYSFCSVSVPLSGDPCSDGDYPAGGVVLDASGNLYGTTPLGGEGSGGTVFELSPQPGGHWTETVLYAFYDSLGATFPVAGVILDAAGNLYGTTRNGGQVFELSPMTGGLWQQTMLVAFNGSIAAPLVFDKAGNLYGTVDLFGATESGSVFALTPGQANSSWTPVVLNTFPAINEGAEGSPGLSGLVIDANGNLYGTGAPLGTNGAGIVFRLTP